MTEAVSVPVLIIGAGPVGLTLAIDLAHRGVRSRVVEKREDHGKLPKMERVNPRTMEHFRRVGLANKVRAAGLPSHLAMDVIVTRSIFEKPLVQISQHSVDQLKDKGVSSFDGSMPLEPYHVVSQYTVEPLLRQAAEDLGVQVDFGIELIDFLQHDGGVTAQVEDHAGQRVAIESDYLIGCDGGSSTVRKQLGVILEGEPRLSSVYQGLIYAEDLYERLPFKGRHFHFLDEHTSFLIVQDDTRHFTLHTKLEHPHEMEERFRQLVGDSVEFEVLFSGEWTMRAMLANGYGEGRVFIAGDAAHLTPPTAGLGMNTGVGDALDLAWKLQGAIQGWGGPCLLPSYEVERREIGRLNVDYSVARLRARQLWRSAVAPETLNSQEGLNSIAELVEQNEAKAGSMEGMELGYRYSASPILPDRDLEDGQEAVEERGIDRPYLAKTEIGARLPHTWIDPGAIAVQDLLPFVSYTLLCLEEGERVAPAFAGEFAKHSAPFSVITLKNEHIRRLYGHSFVLLRPDMHVGWFGEEIPADVEEIVATVTGHGDCAA